jgi:flavin-dependent dehydrogenase
MEQFYDAVIIGGGPGGSTTATFLARAGRRVLLLERERFPRFHVGESLLPYSLPILDRLGVAEKGRAAG